VPLGPGRVSESLCVRIEQYYATVPLLFADAEGYGSLRLFVRKEPGAPYYGGPSHAQPSAEIGGVGTLPTARRQGLAAAVTAALASHARDHGVHTVFLAYVQDSVARIYARLGFRPADVTLPIANQPARS
jgi:GNAT superfamily N-acetyltransferase